MLIIRLIAVIFIMSVFDYGWAVTYYVDYAGGSDSNNGTSPTTSFRHSPGDPNCYGTCASTSLSAGDKVIFKGGVVYNSSTANFRGTIEVNWAGSGDADGSRIIYDGDSGTYAPRWGSGTARAIIDGNGSQDYLFYFPSVKNYVIINNFELRNGYEAGNRGKLIMADNASTYVNVSNCVFHDGGNPTLPNLSGIGIYMAGSYWKIFNNIFYDCYDTAIHMHGRASYNKVYNNEITDKIIWGIVLASLNSSDNQTSNSIYNNSIHDIYYYDGKGPHTDFIYLQLIGTATISDTRIYNNRFYNSVNFGDGSSPSHYGGTAMLFAQNSAENGLGGSINDTYIYNNVFFNPHSYPAVSFGSKGSNVYIYNNTFLGMLSGSTFGGAGGMDAARSFTGVYIKNNIIKTGGFLLSIPNNTTNIEIDYNNYHTSYPYEPFVHKGSFLSYNSWKGLGYDATSYGPTSDPLFQSIGYSNYDLRLQASSPIRNKGTSLCCTFTADLNGICRPQGGVWDIGAYEYNEGSACVCLCNGINVSTSASAPSAPVVGTVTSDTTNISSNTTSTVIPTLSRSDLVRKNIIKRINR